MSTLSQDYSRFACPNCKCKFYGQWNQGNITHHSWMGKNKQIQRLRCRDCKVAFSENKNSLREKAKIHEDQQELLLKCFRWGVCDEGAADICRVNTKTVQLFRSKASKQAESHHEECVHGVEAPGIQMDELRAKQAKSVTWIGAAIALKSLFILAVTFGQRNQGLADGLFAEIWVRCCRFGIILTDGWSCYYNGLMRCFGRVYQPRRAFWRRGKKLAKRLKLDSGSPF